MQDSPKKTALVVDDEPSIRLLLCETLKELGMEVVEAVDGADAIEESMANQFDLTTMDILMPNVDGLDAIRAIRTVDPNARIIVITSCREEAYRLSAHDMGIRHFINKPVHLAEFRRAVAEELQCVE